MRDNNNNSPSSASSSHEQVFTNQVTRHEYDRSCFDVIRFRTRPSGGRYDDSCDLSSNYKYFLTRFYHTFQRVILEALRA